MTRRAAFVPLLIAAILALPEAAAAKSRPELFEWLPNGPEAGPQLFIQYKLDVTGHFDVQCGNTWVYAGFGGGEQDPITQSPAGLISGTASYTTNKIGVGNSFAAARYDANQFDSGGPLVLTLNAQVTPSLATPNVAVGTLALKLYNPGSALPAGPASSARRRGGRHRGHHHHKRKRKSAPKATLIASCDIAFEAPNHYQE